MREVFLNPGTVPARSGRRRGAAAERRKKGRRGRLTGHCGRCVCATLLVAAAGCGPQVGAFWYFFGPQKHEVIAAKFKLTKGPLLILMDDSPALDLPPQTRELVVRSLMDEFKAAGINEKVIPPARVNELRQQNPDFEKKGIRELGRAAGAQQVLWIFPKEFSMADTLDQTLRPARFTVVLKVINAEAERRDEVRLWPVSSEGELVGIEVNPHEVRAAKSSEELLRTMAQRLAVEIAHQFRDHEVPRPEEQPLSGKAP